MVNIKEIKILDPKVKEIKKKEPEEEEESEEDELEEILLNRLRQRRGISNGKSKTSSKLELNEEIQDLPTKRLEDQVQDVKIEKEESKQNEFYKQQDNKPKYESNSNGPVANRTMTFDQTQNTTQPFGFLNQQNNENFRRPEIQNINLSEQSTFVGNRAYDFNPQDKKVDGRTLIEEDKRKYK